MYIYIYNTERGLRKPNVGGVIYFICQMHMVHNYQNFFYPNTNKSAATIDGMKVNEIVYENFICGSLFTEFFRGCAAQGNEIRLLIGNLKGTYF